MHQTKTCDNSVEEDTPRREPPTPEPKNQPKNNLEKYRENIIEKRREQKISTILKTHYRIHTDAFQSRKDSDAILVHQEFSEDKMFDEDLAENNLNEQPLNIKVKDLASRFKNESSSKEIQKTSAKKPVEEVKSSKAIDLPPDLSKNQNLTRNLMQSKSFSKISHPSSGRSSLD